MKPKKRVRPTLREIDLLRNRCASQEERLVEASRRVEQVYAATNAEFERQKELVIAECKGDCERQLIDRDTHHQQMMDRQRTITAEAIADRDRIFTNLTEMLNNARIEAGRLNDRNRGMWHVLCEARSNWWIRTFHRALNRRMIASMGVKPPSL